MAGGAFLEHLLALGDIGLGEVEFDRLRSHASSTCRFAAGKFVACGFDFLTSEMFAGDDPRAKRDDASEEHPAGGSVFAVVHETPAALP